jgi:hypothetical protein
LVVAHVLHSDATVAPHRVGQLGQAWHRLRGATEPYGVEAEAFSVPAGPLAGFAGQGRPYLYLRAFQHMAEPELLCWARQAEEGQRSCLVESDAGQLGVGAALQPVSSSRPASRPDRYPGSQQRLDVPLHGALANLQQPSEFPTTDLAADLQVQQQVHHPRGAHASILIHVHDKRCRESAR